MQIINWCLQQGLAAKGDSCQALYPEFSPQDPYGRRRESSFASCSKAPKMHVTAYIQAHKPTLKYSNKYIHEFLNSLVPCF